MIESLDKNPKPSLRGLVIEGNVRGYAYGTNKPFVKKKNLFL